MLPIVAPAPTTGYLDTRYLRIANNLSDLNNAATARTNIGLVAGGAGDIWVEKAGDTMTGALMIDGSADAIQLRVQANGTQTAKIQTWENSSAGVLASVNGEGCWGIGITPDSRYKFYVYTNQYSADTDVIGLLFACVRQDRTNGSACGFAGDTKAAATYGDNYSADIIGGRVRVQVSAESTRTSTVGSLFAGFYVQSPLITGDGTKVVSQGIHGIRIDNQGNAASSLSYGIKILAQSGSATGYSIYIDAGLVRLGDQAEIEETDTIAGATADGYAAALTLDPGYTAATAQTVTRHNYIELDNVSVAGAGPAAVTDACVFRFDANAGTHKAVDGASVKVTPGGVDAWIKVNVNGTIYYIPAYTSKVA